MIVKLISLYLAISLVNCFVYANEGFEEFEPKFTLKLSNESAINIPTPLLQLFVNKLANGLKAGYTTAQLNDYTDKILANVKDFIIKLGLDPMDLPDEELALFPGSLKLSKGYLEETSSIGRYQDVIAKYSTDTKIFELTLPLTFKELLFTYKYHAQILLLGITGQLDGKIKKAKVNLRLGFNFNTYQAFVDKADVTDTGSISLSFEGNALTDWIIDILSGVITTFFHGLILWIVDIVIQAPIQDVVKVINEAIDSVLHYDGSGSLII